MQLQFLAWRLANTRHSWYEFVITVSANLTRQQAPSVVGFARPGRVSAADTVVEGMIPWLISNGQSGAGTCNIMARTTADSGRVCTDCLRLCVDRIRRTSRRSLARDTPCAHRNRSTRAFHQSSYRE